MRALHCFPPFTWFHSLGSDHPPAPTRTPPAPHPFSITHTFHYAFTRHRMNCTRFCCCAGSTLPLLVLVPDCWPPPLRFLPTGHTHTPHGVAAQRPAGPHTDYTPCVVVKHYPVRVTTRSSDAVYARPSFAAPVFAGAVHDVPRWIGLNSGRSVVVAGSSPLRFPC